MPAPEGPSVFENGVVFTASSSHQRVGISFAHEGFAKVHWFQQLMVPRDHAELVTEGGRRSRRTVDPYMDSGIMFHVERIPPGIRYLDYRLVIGGLWTVDPLNPVTVTSPAGIALSRLRLPAEAQVAAAMPPGIFQFNFRAAPGETVTVAGSFNNWDPFMYELREVSPGFYTLSLPLAPGRFQYVFFHRGEPIPDPSNARRLYSRDGRVVSEAFVH